MKSRTLLSMYFLNNYWKVDLLFAAFCYYDRTAIDVSVS
jgi:hypothetical protein